MAGAGPCCPGACAAARLTLPWSSISTVHQMSRCLRMCTSVVAGGASITSQPTSSMGRTLGWVFGGARVWGTWWMSSAVGPGLGASCAWARGAEGRSFERREVAAEGEECDGPLRSRRGMCRLIWRASVGRGVGGAPLEGGWPHCPVFDKVEWYDVVAVGRWQDSRR